MTTQIVILNQYRSFAISDSRVTIDDCKTYDGEQKIFKISDKLSTVLLLSGNANFEDNEVKNLIEEYVSKTDFGKITSVEEIKDTFNEFIAESSPSSTPDEYIELTFAEFEKVIKKSIDEFDSKDQLIEFLKFNSSDYEVDFLTNNRLLNSNINKLVNTIGIESKVEFEKVKLYLMGCYVKFLIFKSPNIVLVGYDELYENPTYIEYVILFNNQGKMECIERFYIPNCVSTMVFGIAQDDDVDLILTGFNDKTYIDVYHIVLELIDEFGDVTLDKYSILDSIDEKLKTKI